ncbi:MAG: MFS transporter, partial [Acidimicrobiales bacterium]|nr:MFS transporter [Acidimicrobiales bacterium]
GFAGLGQGWCNPATNKLIAERVPAGRRGTITGLKQSGVMFGIFLSGSTLPTLAVWFGWRTAMGIYGAAALVCALGIQLWMRPDADPNAEEQAEYEAPPGAVFAVKPLHPRPVRMALAERVYITKIAWFSLLMGGVVGGVGRFQVLFAEQSLGWTNFWAGMASALAGITAAGSRIWWARLTETRVRPASALAIQSAFTVVAMALLLATTSVHGSLMWVMSLLAGFTMMSWNAVAMLAIITGVPVALAGRASGIVMLGFMSGLSIGGLAAGYVIEWTGGFDTVWLAFAVCAAGASVLAMTMRRRRAVT